MRLIDEHDVHRNEMGDTSPPQPSSGGSVTQIDAVAALLRYKWAVLIPCLVGGCVGFLIWSQLPEIYESSSRILVESDNPIILDSSTGEVVNGVPGADVIQAQLYSDQVMAMASKSELLHAPEIDSILSSEFGGSFPNFAITTVQFEPEAEGKQALNSLAFRLSVRHTSEQLVDAASQALNAALIKYFDDRREDSIVKLREFIRTATEKYEPKLAELEKRHREFQQNNPLEYDVNGNAINPHRVKIIQLKQTRSELEAQLNQLSGSLAIIEATLKETRDTRTAIDIIGQYLDRELVTPIKRMRNFGLVENDFDLKKLGFEQQLIPLMVARQEAAAQYGENHPSVVTLDEQIKYSRREFEKLSREWTDRMAAVLDDSEKELAEARQAGVTIVTAMRAQIQGLKLQLQELDRMLEFERESADELASAEQADASIRSEILQAKDLLATLKEQMARVNLAERQAGVVLTQLNRPSKAVVVGPNIFLLTGGGLALGLMLGCALAYLLETQAATFRTADEISSYLNVQILSHVPYDPGKRPKLRKGEVDPYHDLDDKLAIVHRPNSMAAEAVRACRTSVFFESNVRGARVLQVTSPLPSDGKTTLAGNLAASIAQAGKRVVIVDCDLRRPQISDNFAHGDSLGLTNVLNGDCEPNDVVYTTAVTNLSVMPSGPIPYNPSEALTLPIFREVLDWLKDRFDYVIVDTPPLLVVTDPSIIAGYVDGVVMAMKVRRKSRANAREALSILRAVKAEILGVVINASDDTAGSDGYRGYGYYKYNRYASKYGVDSPYGGSKYRGRLGGKKNSKSTLMIGNKEIDGGGDQSDTKKRVKSCE